MSKGIGIQLDEQTNDLKIAINRDLNGVIIRGVVVDGITTQNQFILLAAHTGELKNAPIVGVGISDMLLDNDDLFWKIRVRKTLEDEGQKIKTLEFKNDKIKIDANY